MLQKCIPVILIKQGAKKNVTGYKSVFHWRVIRAQSTKCNRLYFIQKAVSIFILFHHTIENFFPADYRRFGQIKREEPQDTPSKPRE